MKNYFLLIVVFIGFVQTFFSQTSLITIPCATEPVIDGKKLGAEWNNADTVRITLGQAGKSIKVYFMKDRDNLYFLYAGNLESQMHFPELLLDINNAKSTVWQPDDWWFHVSATDCESQGNHSVFTNCQLVQPGWQAQNNILQGLPITDTVEIKIPFNKIGLSAGGGYTIGISFSTYNIQATAVAPSWPPSTNVTNPSTWATAKLLLCEPTLLDEPVRGEQDGMQLFPNPSAGSFNINWPGKTFPVPYQLTTITGASVLSGNLQHGYNPINSALKPGIYFITVYEPGNIQQTKKLIINN